MEKSSHKYPVGEAIFQPSICKHFVNSAFCHLFSLIRKFEGQISTARRKIVSHIRTFEGVKVKAVRRKIYLSTCTEWEGLFIRV